MTKKDHGDSSKSEVVGGCGNDEKWITEQNPQSGTHKK